jgi:hypothetical protein
MKHRSDIPAMGCMFEGFSEILGRSEGDDRMAFGEQLIGGVGASAATERDDLVTGTCQMECQ